MEPWDDYNIHDKKSVLKHAAKLTKKTLNEILGTCGFDIVGGINSKGKFGQIIEEGYFLIDNNNRHEADFADLSIELKTHPMIKKEKKMLVAKERLSLGIINYMEADEENFDTFSKKNSHLLLVFYMWTPKTSIFDYRFLKVVDWTPSPVELQMIHEDWNVIYHFIHNGEAHLLSERYTKILAANRKGAGHDKDLRCQPHSNIPAKQRSLSFKTKFMTTMYYSNPNIGEKLNKQTEKYEPIFEGPWNEDTDFESAVLLRLQKFVGMTGYEIEAELDINLNPIAKQYYKNLCNNMMGAHGKKDVKELMEADISMKTIRIRLDGKPKECMSFSYFKYKDIAEEKWEDSDFISQIDCRFLFPIFSFNTNKPDKEKDRKALVFTGAFFWALPEKEFAMAREIWEDTKQKTIEERIEDYIPKSGHPVFHVRTHGKKKTDTDQYMDKEYTKRCFWINDTYLKSVVTEELYGPHSTKMKKKVPHTLKHI